LKSLRAANVPETPNALRKRDELNFTLSGRQKTGSKN